MASPTDKAGAEASVYIVTVTLTDIALPRPAVFQERYRAVTVAYGRAQQYVLEGYRVFEDDGVSFTLYPPHRISHVRVRAVAEEGENHESG